MLENPEMLRKRPKGTETAVRIINTQYRECDGWKLVVLCLYLQWRLDKHKVCRQSLMHYYLDSSCTAVLWCVYKKKKRCYLHCKNCLVKITMSAGYCSINVQISSHANTIIIHQPPHNSIKHLSASQQTLVHIQPPAGYHPYTCGHLKTKPKSSHKSHSAESSVSCKLSWC